MFYGNNAVVLLLLRSKGDNTKRWRFQVETRHFKPNINLEKSVLEPEKDWEELETRNFEQRQAPPQRTRAQISREEAKRLATQKFEFYKWFTIYLFNSIILVGINVWLRRTDITHPFWFQWPVLLWGIVLMFPFIRVFLLKGQSLHVMIEKRLEEMAEREMDRATY